MMQYTIDINADVGEGVGNEPALMPYLTSCNIACGGHAGTTETMQTVVKLAKQYGVKIGAHPSFPDTEHFGREPMDMSFAALFVSIQKQIDSLMHVLQEEHLNLNHVKPHGALYNLAANDEKIAMVIIEALKRFMLPVKLYVPYKSVIADLAIKNKIPIVYEVFADRQYNTDLTLVSRKKTNAFIHDSDVLVEHVYNMVVNQKVKTVGGEEVDIKAETCCVHGDNLDAVNLIKNLRIYLEEKGINIL
ncbi:5-oxoprolinase subunit PxpA [Confluentibacter flavum]|uniref:Lactam utilization protein LamB n=1 Tax=Confluentibacter flavum TaxID=1909700 RepID=A0A2N3HMT5_9FLAO|nr:5-oxoprolinase subunit PxpA [Confluentibacter flavum]PKQ46241.1 lactam utilization protein LamB [Confluentibacter flavum]